MQCIHIAELTQLLLGKKLHFILSNKFDLHIINNLSTAVHAFASSILMSFSVNEMLLLRYVNLSTGFREPPFSVEMSPLWLKDVLHFVWSYNCSCRRKYCNTRQSINVLLDLWKWYSNLFVLFWLFLNWLSNVMHSTVQ